MKCNTCGKMNCMAHGGAVHKIAPNFDRKVEHQHNKILSEMRMMPKPKLKGVAHGGEVEDDEMKTYPMSPDVPSMHPKTMKDGGDVDMNKEDSASIDNELNDMVMDELFDSMEKKDKKGCLDAIRALVLNCMGEK